MIVGVNLNARALQLVAELDRQAQVLRVAEHVRSEGGSTYDLGINVPGGLEAGRRLAEICLAGLGQVSFVPAGERLPCDVEVQVVTDQPVAACMASQYAGWQVAGEKFFAMGSGPMRAAAGREAIFDKIGHRESVTHAVGVLEGRKLPSEAVVADVASKCGVEPQRLTLLVAPTASQAGNVQVVARSIETALHKLSELDFDLARIVSGYGRAPLPPVAKDDLAGIGRTNDAVLYGARVTLWVTGDDDSIRQVGPRTPSSASPAYGEPFATIFEKSGRDFYKIDPCLFSPAAIAFVNVTTGRRHSFGTISPDVIERSFST